MPSTLLPSEISHSDSASYPENLRAENFFADTRAAVLALVALSFPLFFFRMGAWGFFDPDEGRYAEIPREMLERGDWITPFLNGTRYYEKPPLFYWSVATLFQTFGLHEWAARLAPALSGLAGVLVAYVLGRRMFGARAGFLGAVVLSTSILWAFMARELVIDMEFSVLLFCALALWWMGHSQIESTRSSTQSNKRKALYFLGFWALLALAILAKGPVAVVLSVAVIGCYSMLCCQWSTLRAMQWLPGLILFFAIAAPWYVLVAQRNPQWNHYFWYGQNIARFLGKGENREHVQSPFYFIVLLPVLFFPWTFFVPAAIAFGWGKLRAARADKFQTPSQRAAIFLLAMSLLVLLFFSASTSKLVPYILPMFPPTAILLGAYLDRVIEYSSLQRDKLFRGGFWFLTALLGVCAPAILIVAPKFLRRIEGLSGAWAIAGCAVFALWFLALVVSRGRVGRITSAVAGGCTLFIAVAVCLAPAIAPNHQVQPLIAYIQPGLDAGGDVMTMGMITQSVGFYARRRVRLFNGAGETAFGASLLSAEERRQWFIDPDELPHFFASPQPVYCVVTDHSKALRLLPRLPAGCKEIIWNKRRSVIGNAKAVKITPPVGDLLGQSD